MSTRRGVPHTEDSDGTCSDECAATHPDHASTRGTDHPGLTVGATYDYDDHYAQEVRTVTLESVNDNGYTLMVSDESGTLHYCEPDDLHPAGESPLR